MKFSITKNPDTQLIEFQGAFSQEDLRIAFGRMSKVEKIAADQIGRNPGDMFVSDTLAVLEAIARHVDEDRKVADARGEAPAACHHEYQFFGDQVDQRRCIMCNHLEPKSKVNRDGKTPAEVAANLTPYQLMVAKKLTCSNRPHVVPFDALARSTYDELVQLGVAEFAGATDRFSLKTIYRDHIK